MIAIQNKNLLVGLVIAVMVLVVSMFGTPADVFADDVTNGTDISVSMDGGTISIEGAGFEEQTDGSAWTNFFTKYQTVISGVSGIAAITFIAFFIFYFMKLGATAGNPQARSQALLGLLWTGIAAAGLGSVSIVVGFFYNSMK